MPVLNVPPRLRLPASRAFVHVTTVLCLSPDLLLTASFDPWYLPRSFESNIERALRGFEWMTRQNPRADIEAGSGSDSNCNSTPAFTEINSIGGDS
jgi:hypothetical protein